MARIEPLLSAELPQYVPIFDLIEQTMGFVPTSLPTMARIPALFDTFETDARSGNRASTGPAARGNATASATATALGTGTSRSTLNPVTGSSSVTTIDLDRPAATRDASRLPERAAQVSLPRCACVLPHRARRARREVRVGGALRGCSARIAAGNAGEGTAWLRKQVGPTKSRPS